MAASKKRPPRARGGRDADKGGRPPAEGGAAPAKGNLAAEPRPALFLVFLLLGAFALAALASFSPRQEFFFSESLLDGFVLESPLTDGNLCGRLGATFAVLAFNFFGVGAFMLPFFAFLIAFWMLRSRADASMYWKCTLMFFLLASGTLLLTLSFDATTRFAAMPEGVGGGFGRLLFGELCRPLLGVAGTATLGAVVYLLCLTALLVAPPQRILAKLTDAVAAALSRRRERARALREERRRLIEARRRNALALREQMREAQIDASSAVPMRAGAPVAVLPEKSSEADDDEIDFSDVPVGENAAPECAAGMPESAPEPEEPVPVAAADEPETPADEDEEEDEEERAPEPEKILGTLRPFPREETPAPVPADENESVPAEATPPDEEPAPAEETAPEPRARAVPAPAPAEFRVIEEDAIERAELADEPHRRGAYKFPPMELLKAPPEEKTSEASHEEFRERGEQIVSALAKFKISSELTTVQVGPTITRYEITPQDDVRVEKILSLQNNIAMRLKVQSARLALVPEHGTVGIEVPNRKPKPVFIREILESRAWHENEMEIPIVLGKDVTGKPVLMDLAKMPHGLIAGSTGSGKSVCINGIVTSILYSATPEDVRLVMVDPKAVELQMYNKVPHMLIPVITDAKKVSGALKWLINEMERRYQLLKAANVRNIVGFNAKLIKDREEAAAARERAAALEKELSAEERAAIAESAEARTELSVPRDEGVLDELAAKRKMSYIVCIIDEFADLMQVVGPEIDSAIHRLTAKARAAGIHLILATQRPDAKVVTGVIKANLPVRVAFKVTSAVNSKIILDEVGAESLIGKGDMLIVPPGTSVLSRAQGSFVSEDEIDAIVNYLHDENGAPQYAQEVQEAIDRAAEEAEAEKNGGKGDDEDDVDLNDDEALADKAWEIIRTTKRASTSWLQTKLRIGYGRATRVMDVLEERGWIGPPQTGSKTRDILRDD
ncbi:MAG: DNA translocase FtsK 4TM domain-containing protein [Candidatus Spyradosoma sp.]